ncbi:MAG: hypothetical protein R2873_05140 [Caldilineaceae bacterium]
MGFHFRRLPHMAQVIVVVSAPPVSAAGSPPPAGGGVGTVQAETSISANTSNANTRM